MYFMLLTLLLAVLIAGLALGFAVGCRMPERVSAEPRREESRAREHRPAERR